MSEYLDNTDGGDLDRAITWQYDQASHLVGMIEMFKDFFNQSTTWFYTGNPDASESDDGKGLAQRLDISDPTKCDDYGLSVWGALLGVDRPRLTYIHGTESVARTTPMSTELYRKILVARIRLVQTNASVPAYITYVKSIFGNNVTVVDGKDMALSFVEKDGSTLGNEEKAALQQAYDVIFYYPSGVRSNTEDAGPVFGFEGQATNLNTSVVVDVKNNNAGNVTIVSTDKIVHGGVVYNPVVGQSGETITTGQTAHIRFKAATSGVGYFVNHGEITQIIRGESAITGLFVCNHDRSHRDFAIGGLVGLAESESFESEPVPSVFEWDRFRDWIGPCSHGSESTD